SLADLHRESGIPKSTIRRLLGTLRSRRIVRRSIADGRYRINITLNTGVAAPVPKGAGLLVDVAIPVLTEHTERVGWPSDIHIIDGVAMRVIESTRPLSPFHLYRSVVNLAINIFGSATGQACLASMPDERIRDFIRRARGNRRLALERFSLDEAALFRSIEATRARGYGVRLRQYRGETVIDDRLGAIGVPVKRHGRVFGAVSLVFPSSLASAEKMARAHLESLVAAASAIEDDLDHYGGKASDEGLRQ
ncbi:MAG: IclR family transcriptional regulator C-terminal domain-containing protein, partial [Pseudomonadota bacterium]|nr:IclR family transcriptional regulator C-terminal domain-containing protein [Pseudomonadota bacterium]